MSKQRAQRTGRGSSGAVDLPLTVPLIAGESTASYLVRTAVANAVAEGELLRALRDGPGRLRADPLQPGTEEVHLSAGSAALLAELVIVRREKLARVLPHLQPEHLLDDQVPRVRRVAWPEGFGRAPLPAYPLCMEEGAWLVCFGRRWRPCGCGRRWLIGDRGGYLVDPTPLPQLARTLRQHQALVRRLGPIAQALVADAHQVALWWWAHRREVAGALWRQREDAVAPVRGRRRRLAPMIVYPETLALAEAMWAWEQQRQRPGADPQGWLESVGERFGCPGIGRRPEGVPLRYWLAHHHAVQRPAPAGSGRAAAGAEKETADADRRRARLPAGHHLLTGPGLFAATSCLPWIYGKPLTSVEVCPRCGGRAPSCRWGPSPTCTGPPG